MKPKTIKELLWELYTDKIINAGQHSNLIVALENHDHELTEIVIEAWKS